jgi:hypothetical protein
MKGWIKLHRRLRDHWLWPNDRPYSKLEAWIDLIFSANHKATKLNIDFKTVPVERGQFLVSQVKLAQKWQWHRETVSKFLRFLENEKMTSIQTSKETSSGFTLITIRNYGKYQDGDESVTDIQTDIERVSVADIQAAHHKNEKNEKKETAESDELIPHSHTAKEAKNAVDKQLLSHSKKKQTRAAGDDRVRPFLVWFAEEYEKRHSAPYAIRWGKDGKLVKELPSAFDLARLKDLAVQFLESSDPWVRQNGGFTVGVFISQINKLASTSGNGHTKPPEVKDLGDGWLEVDGMKISRKDFDRRQWKTA